MEASIHFCILLSFLLVSVNRMNQNKIFISLWSSWTECESIALSLLGQSVQLVTYLFYQLQFFTLHSSHRPLSVCVYVYVSTYYDEFWFDEPAFPTRPHNMLKMVKWTFSRTYVHSLTNDLEKKNNHFFPQAPETGFVFEFLSSFP